MVAFKAMVSAVFIVFIGMIMYSVITPEINKVNEEVAKTDPSGMATKTLDATNSVPDPKETVKQSAGSFLLDLLQNHPILFMILVAITAAILIALGVTVAQVLRF